MIVMYSFAISSSKGDSRGMVNLTLGTGRRKLTVVLYRSILTLFMIYVKSWGTWKPSNFHHFLFV